MEHHPDPILRQKRRQVAKACDNCRLHRIKCDNNLPCTNCKTRSSHCSNSDENKGMPKLKQACEEIALLKQKVEELEKELKRERGNTQASQDRLQLPTHPHTPPSSTCSPEAPESLSQPRSNGPYDSEGERPKTKLKFREGIQLRPAKRANATFFGPSSLYYYVNRLSSTLASSLRQGHSAESMLLQSVSSGKLLEGLSVASEEDQVPSTAVASRVEPGYSGPHLTATQEEYFLNHFWESYHTSLFSILDEAEFKRHHQSLWMTSSKTRKPSALVDIVLAMCMQYAVSALPYSQQEVLVESNYNDATIAGRWYYRRCQTLLTHELESPTMSTLQSHLLCAIYLCGGSFHNMVDASSALAVRTAYTLGLHLEPPASLPPAEQEKRRRMWWAVYVLDSKVSMKLGRPFLINDSFAMPRLPSDDFEAAMHSGSTFASLGPNTTWLSFNLHNTTLYIAVRKAFSAFYEKDVDTVSGQTIWGRIQALETLAEVLDPHIKQLDNWVSDVPEGLKTRRQNNGQAFSTDGSTLEIEKFAPLWLQRQRLLLELTYHHLKINLYRPFITLVPQSMAGSLAEQNAMACASHAVAFTKIAEQVVASTTILAGWYEVFQWQFSATMSLAGFIYTYPQNALTPAARDAISLSISVFDVFGGSFAVAISAAKIVHDLMPKLDFLSFQATAGATTMQSANRDGYASQSPTNILETPPAAALIDSTATSFLSPEMYLASDTIAEDPSLSLTTTSIMTPPSDHFWLANIPPHFDLNQTQESNQTPHEYNNFDMTDSSLFDLAMDIEFWGDLTDLYPTTNNFAPQSWVF